MNEYLFLSFKCNGKQTVTKETARCSLSNWIKVKLKLIDTRTTRTSIRDNMNRLVALCVLLLSYVISYRLHRLVGPPSHRSAHSLKSSYLDELNVFKAEKKVLVGLTTVRSE